MKFARFLVLWLALFGLCIAARLPYLLSDRLFIDIDEATIGIMAKDLLKGKPLAYYFYLQNYGFSTIETIVTALFIKICGPGVWALKLGGLFLYSLGSSFLVRYLIDKQTGRLLVFCSIIIIVAFPPWFMWGMLMRGGYITAFACAMAVFYITQAKQNSYVLVSVSALLFYIGYESNAVIFLPVFPLLIYWLWSHKFVLWKWMTFFLVFIVPLVLGRILFVDKQLGDIQMDFSFHQVSMSLISFTGFWHHAFTNFYFYNSVFTIPMYWKVLSLVLVLLFLYIIATGSISRENRIRWLLVLSGTVASLIIAGTALSFSIRYSQGLFTGVLILIIISIASSRGKVIKYLLPLMALITFTGTSTGSKIGSHWIQTSANELHEMDELYHRVKERHISALYSTDRTSVWDYLYGDDIPSSHVCGFDRSVQFSIRLNKLKAKNKKIGLFGNTGYQSELKNNPGERDTFLIAERYFLIENINDTLLMQIQEKVCAH